MTHWTRKLPPAGERARGEDAGTRLRSTTAVVMTALALAAPVAASGQATSYDECRNGGEPGVTVRPGTLEAATCIPAGENTTQSGGNASGCGNVVVAGLAVAGDPQRDPEIQCWGEAQRGSGMPGRLYEPAIRSEHGVVAARSPLAAQAGVKALERGGNAIDAAAAATFAAGVVRPEMCGIGGGGFLVYRKADGKVATLDFSEETPAAMNAQHYESAGRDEFSAGYRMVGVPGTVAGMDAAIRRFGKLTLGDAVTPAARLADDGFEVSTALAYSYVVYDALTEGLKGNILGPRGSPYAHWLRLRMDDEAASTYLNHGAMPPRAGSKLRLVDYAETLRTIAEEGADAFYRGKIAKKIVASVRASQGSPLPGDHGIMTLEDLADYKPKWRKPLTGTYRDTQIVTVGPSSAGGTFLIEALNILEGFDLAEWRHSSADHLHVLAETQKLAWADVRAHVDPEDRFPVATLTSKEWAAKRRAEIDMDKAQSPSAGQLAESDQTLHLSVLDRKGNAAAVTCSVGGRFGAAVVPEGTGFLLNSEIPGGIGKDKLEGGRRFRSSKTPAIVVRDGIPILATGAAGGPMIPAGVLGAVSNAVDFGMDPARAIDAARVDATTFGDELAIEGARVPVDVLEDLRKRGHQLLDAGVEYRSFGAPILAAVGVDPATGEHLASDDPREQRGPAAQARRSR